ncbi:MAG: DUF1513 domain-containing protein [Pseudomonadota bacterium]
MPTRRDLVTTAAAAGLATGLAPGLGWAEAGAPRYLSAARLTDGSYALFGLNRDGRDLFTILLPARGHAAAVHPTTPLAVAFARRPGTFALVIDCATGRERHRLTAPAGRHFGGHGCFSRDGTRLYTTENAYEIGEGRIGIWSAVEGYRRVGEVPSGGIGPHEMLRLPGSDTLVVANGGILTHPDSGRAKLNLPTMAPNLTYLSAAGAVLEQVALPSLYRMNSIRHLAVRQDGLVACAMQWQGTLTTIPPLVALHRLGGGPARLLGTEQVEQRATRGYAGSIAFSADGTMVAITAPRGGRMHVFDAERGRLLSRFDRADVCGVAPAPGGFLATDGGGQVTLVGRDATAPQPVPAASRAWDNHLIAL